MERRESDAGDVGSAARLIFVDKGQRLDKVAAFDFGKRRPEAERDTVLSCSYGAVG
ncbi:MAG: hypothetical protein H0T45_15025 [Pyrinomonadaceae bacterium]|nr:hypothetical protein [Pyrinomonadaceae bacterium]